MYTIIIILAIISILFLPLLFGKFMFKIYDSFMNVMVDTLDAINKFKNRIIEDKPTTVGR